MRPLLPLFLALTLAACGFQLRGARELPFDTLYIALPEMAELRAVLKRNIEASSKTKVVAEAKEAQVTLAVTFDQPVKNILSLNSAGQVREYELVRTFAFRVFDKNNRDMMVPARIVIRRDITYNDAQVLSKESEESLLWRDMQNDLVQQILRRLAAAKPKAEES